MKKKLIIILFAVFVATVFAQNESQSLIDGELNEGQINALLAVTINPYLMCDNDGVWSEKVKTIDMTSRSTISASLRPGWWGEEIKITRMGKVQANGTLAIQFDFKGQSYYQDNGELIEYPPVAHPFSKSGVVVKITKSTDDFGDIHYLCAAPDNRTMANNVRGANLSLANLTAVIAFLENKPIPLTEKAAIAATEKIASTESRNAVNEEQKPYLRIIVGMIMKGTYGNGGSDVTITITNVEQENSGKISVMARIDCLMSHKTPAAYTTKGKIYIEQNGMILEKDKVINMPFLSSPIGFNGKFSIEQGKVKWSGMVIEIPKMDFVVIEQ